MACAIAAARSARLPGKLLVGAVYAVYGGVSEYIMARLSDFWRMSYIAAFFFDSSAPTSPVVRATGYSGHAV